jgi:hypothetical protein
MKVCIGLLTHCDSGKSPERFKVMKECIEALAYIKTKDTYLYVWDNNSSNDVRAFLKAQDHIDEFCFSDKNLYDVVAVHYLAKKAEELGSEYVMHLEDDLFFYDRDFWGECFAFMKLHQDCGYLRILKYDCDDKEKYTKDSGHPAPDKANWQRHNNCITNEKLEWEACGHLGKYRFYKNNWHWYNFVSLARLDVFKKLLPHEDQRPLQGLEGYMMKRYAELGLKVGVMDKGVVDHRGAFNTKTSARLAKVAQHGGHNLPHIGYTKVIEEVERFLNVEDKQEDKDSQLAADRNE